LSIDEKQTPYDVVTTYNNFYEFGTDKSDPAENATKIQGGAVVGSVEGEIKRPKVYDIEELMKWRRSRSACTGCAASKAGRSCAMGRLFAQRADQARRADGNAKYVEFVTLADPKQMPGVSSSVLDWPYVEGLRLDEAQHPLTLLTLGVYGQTLPNQNGAPVRIIVPWKYGFKSGKSLVKIRFVEKQPQTAWMRAGPSEYGFYSNVNPDVDHPRWSQATERRLGRNHQAEDADVQRLRRAGRVDVCRDGLKKLLASRTGIRPRPCLPEEALPHGCGAEPDRQARQGDRLRRWRCCRWRAGRRLLPRSARRQSDRADHALDRHVDADVPADHAGGDAAAPADGWHWLLSCGGCSASSRSSMRACTSPRTSGSTSSSTGRRSGRTS
jgi:DMSO/TMAO reductase YedYZ molybdopterin-dependent catalytic subunit